MILIWEASDRICGKRLKSALPHLVESIERACHLDLDPEVASSRKRRRNLQRGRHIPVRTFADWDQPPPGFLEIDLGLTAGRAWAVPSSTAWLRLHRPDRGGAAAGQRAVPGGGRTGSHCQAAVFPRPRHRLRQRQCVHQRHPHRVLRRSGHRVHRSRAYRKNDQAWVEQKNGAVIRRFLGHERYSGQVAGQSIAHLHGAMRLYVNYFQPSFKLVEKTRNGSAVTKRYSPPATPCDRVIHHEAVSAGAKAKLTIGPGRHRVPRAQAHSHRRGLGPASG